MKYFAVVMNFFLVGFLLYLLFGPGLSSLLTTVAVILVVLFLYTNYVLLEDTGIVPVYISTGLNVLFGFILYVPVLIASSKISETMQPLLVNRPAAEQTSDVVNLAPGVTDISQSMYQQHSSLLENLPTIMALVIFVPVLVNYTALYQKRNRLLKKMR